MSGAPKIVFAGPSLAGAALVDRADLRFRPPVRQGDLYLAACENPAAIGIIDGVFDGVPSVWHKEILWAMAQGIPVYGAASMGALRAAELDLFGMVGVGAIYEAYRDGTFEDDDEVALQHGPAEMNYAPLSVPMVNVRATLAAAVGAGILAQASADALTAAAKALFFKKRTWETVFEAAAGSFGGAPEAAAGRNWCIDNAVDQKERDALLLLDRLENPAPGESIAYDFEHTEMWEQGVSAWTRGTPVENAADDGGYRLVPEERLLR